MDDKIDLNEIDWENPIASVDGDQLDDALVELLLDLEFFSRKTGRVRDHYIVALSSVADFLTALRTPERFHGLFSRLAVDLSDLDRGTVPQSLTPESKVGSRGETYEWMGRAKICLAMVALNAAGKSYKEAAAYVVAHFGKTVADLRSSHDGDPARAVYSWHERFTAPSPSNNEFAQAAYERHAPKIAASIRAFPETERLRNAHTILADYVSKIVLPKQMRGSLE